MADIQYVGHVIFKKPHDFRETLYSKFFRVADYEFDIGFSELKIADPKWRT